ncbi:MAG: DUF554 domain-containing protein [Lachnospiraceae bacterium]|nr:DUF554 domain-containing protein [Lachnospiraceae bacterium]
MLGTLVNAAAIVVGGAIGLLLKKGLPKKMADTLMKGLGLCTLYIGISGCLEGENTLVLIVSMVLGTILGEAVDLDDKINRLGNFLERKFGGKKNSDAETAEAGSVSGAGTDAVNAGAGQAPKVSLAEGFVTSSLLFCVGAMAIVGSLQSGLTGNHDTLFAKSLLDFVAAIIFASSLGVGVLLSAGLLFLYQGSITLLAQFIEPFLTDPVIAEMNCVGNVIIIGLAMNMLGITKLKVMNFVPAIVLPIVLCPLFL